MCTLKQKKLRFCDYLNLDIKIVVDYVGAKHRKIGCVFSAAHVPNQHGIKVISNILYTHDTHVYMPI